MKRLMKTLEIALCLIITLLIDAAVFGFIYLIGCFIEVSFNPVDWIKDTRVIVGYIGGVIFVALLIILTIAIFTNDEEETE